MEQGAINRKERLKRLMEHADALEVVKWQLDDKGRPIYEKAWREVMDQIDRQAKSLEMKTADFSSQTVENVPSRRDVNQDQFIAEALATLRTQDIEPASDTELIEALRPR